MTNRMSLCLLSAAIVVGGCSSSNGGAGGGSDVPKEAYELAKARVLDLGFKNCGDFWGSVYKKDNPLDFTTPAEYQFKNLQMQVQTFPKTISEADKLNGIQWQGMVSVVGRLRCTIYGPVDAGGEWKVHDGRFRDGFAGCLSSMIACEFPPPAATSAFNYLEFVAAGAA